jgi:hypothetical protein
MRIFAKIVAIVVGLVLMATPTFAAMSCGTSTAVMNHDSCCAKVAKMMKVHQADSPAGCTGSALSQSSCCKLSSDNSSKQTIAREERRPVTETVAIAEASLVGLAIPASSSRDASFLPDRPVSSRLRSLLCTFLI